MRDFYRCANDRDFFYEIFFNGFRVKDQKEVARQVKLLKRFTLWFETVYCADAVDPDSQPI